MDLNNIGKWKISVLETGDFRLDGGAMMGSVPKVLWEKTNPSDEFNRIDLSLPFYLMKMKQVYQNPLVTLTLMHSQ